MMKLSRGLLLTLLFAGMLFLSGPPLQAGLACTGPCQTCQFTILGNFCANADFATGRCQCLQIQGLPARCALYSEACFGIIILG